ncbi:methyltransferase domain-containing protein [Candidatus Falkowbacteria bacterium]|nr:methyltransferase domain-containing protein [Candidatus Falkowbacteria bacterium]
MLPPKLAKMMINLSTVSPLSKGGLRGVLLDPFCGSGTILMQAALLGYQNAIGSDLSPKAMADTKQNLAFLTKSLPQLSTLNYQLSTLDATKLSTTHKPNSIDAIVTEPFLGPPLRGSEPTEAIKKIISELSTLYLRAFAEFKKILKPDGRVVIIFPILKSWPSISDQQLEQIKTLGLAPAWNVPELLRPLLTKRHSVIYSRPGQRIEREIFVFKKIK